jgi:integrase
MNRAVGAAEEAVEVLERDDVDQEELDVLDAFDRSNPQPKLAFTVEYIGTQIIIAGMYRPRIAALLSMDSVTVAGIKSTIQAIAAGARLSPTSLSPQLRMMARAVELVPITQFTAENYPLLIEKMSDSEVNMFRTFLVLWHRLGYPGIDSETIDIVNLLVRPSPKTQRRVTSGDPTKGWYTEQEYDDLVSTYWNDYECEAVSLRSSVALLLNAQYGRRGLQKAQLKICDFESSGETDGVTGKRVAFPGVKDRGSAGWFRDSKFEVHPMGDDLWELCQLQIESSINSFETFLQRELTSAEREQLPFFQLIHPQGWKNRAYSAEKQTTLLEQLESPTWHVSASSMAQILIRDYGSPVMSALTGELVHEFGYRMRYTRARQLARMGVPRKTLSYWMGHESLKSIEAYYNDPAEGARLLNESMKIILAPLAQAFSGSIRDKESDAIRGSDLSSRIELDGRKGVGTCGEFGFCSASVPVPCYRCTKFQPWVYGPHEEVLFRLLDRQEEENNIHLPSKARRMLVPLQLDKDIDAVKLVIRLCDLRKNELTAEEKQAQKKQQQEQQANVKVGK